MRTPYVTFDLVNRYWRDLGHRVHYVQNVTDIDDPLLERAVATGRDWRELARVETALFARDMRALNVLPPEDCVGAVESLRADGVPPPVLRLALLGHHNRSDWEWTPEDIAVAQARFRSWRAAVGAPGRSPAAAPGLASPCPAAEGLAAVVRSRLADDLDAPGALAAVDDWVAGQASVGGMDPDAPGQIRVLLDTLLGVDLS